MFHIHTVYFIVRVVVERSKFPYVCTHVCRGVHPWRQQAQKKGTKTTSAGTTTLQGKKLNENFMTVDEFKR